MPANLKKLKEKPLFTLPDQGSLAGRQKNPFEALAQTMGGWLSFLPPDKQMTATQLPGMGQLLGTADPENPILEGERPFNNKKLEKRVNKFLPWWEKYSMKGVQTVNPALKDPKV